MTSRAKIVILDGYTINPGDNPWSQLEALGDCTIYDRTPPELTLERARDAEIILLSKVKLDAAALGALPKLKYISLLATGYNNVDVAAAGARGIPVSNVPAYSTESVAQTTFALLLELAVNVAVHDAAVKARRVGALSGPFILEDADRRAERVDDRRRWVRCHRQGRGTYRCGIRHAGDCLYTPYSAGCRPGSGQFRPPGGVVRCRRCGDAQLPPDPGKYRIR